ncbi:uncharacterized protein TNCV_3803031 [Trichonephila clavipes]|nr:uncharacterized protein TNCV_3803031 [Trichonephila clavipes]
MSFLSLMAVTQPERALLEKLFYESKGNAAAALREFRRLKNFCKGPLLPQALKIMIAQFEKTGHLGVQPGRGRKSTRSDVVGDVATAIVDQSMDNFIGCSSAHAVSRHLGVPYSTVWNVVSEVVHFFPYKIRHNQQLMANDREKRLTFALTFLARVEACASWPWKILWSDEAHIHLSGTVNTHNCLILDTENPRTFQENPLHSPKVTVCRAFPTAWPPRSPDLNPCVFWLWGYLKNLVYRGRLITLADLKDSITLHVRSISVDQLRLAVEQTLHRLQILHLEEGKHIEQHSLHR